MNYELELRLPTFNYLVNLLVFLLARYFNIEMEQISPVAAARGSQKSTASGASTESSGSVTKR